jgi:hypothetical protein
MMVGIFVTGAITASIMAGIRTAMGAMVAGMMDTMPRTILTAGTLDGSKAIIAATKTSSGSLIATTLIDSTTDTLSTTAERTRRRTTTG